MLRTVKGDDVRDSGEIKHRGLERYEVRGLEGERGYQRTVIMSSGT